MYTFALFYVADLLQSPLCISVYIVPHLYDTFQK